MIINPWIFYVINILVSLEDLLFMIDCILIFLIIGLVCVFILVKEESDDIVGDVPEKYIKRYDRYISWIKNSVIAFFICAIIVALIPTQETMYTMLVSSYVTTDNIETVSDVIQDSVDYIFEKINNEGE